MKDISKAWKHTFGGYWKDKLFLFALYFSPYLVPLEFGILSK